MKNRFNEYGLGLESESNQEPVVSAAEEGKKDDDEVIVESPAVQGDETPAPSATETPAESEAAEAAPAEESPAEVEGAAAPAEPVAEEAPQPAEVEPAPAPAPRRAILIEGEEEPAPQEAPAATAEAPIEQSEGEASAVEEPVASEPAEPAAEEPVAAVEPVEPEAAPQEEAPVAEEPQVATEPAETSEAEPVAEEASAEPVAEEPAPVDNGPVQTEEPAAAVEEPVVEGDSPSESTLDEPVAPAEPKPLEPAPVVAEEPNGIVAPAEPEAAPASADQPAPVEGSAVDPDAVVEGEAEQAEDLTAASVAEAVDDAFEKHEEERQELEDTATALEAIAVSLETQTYGRAINPIAMDLARQAINVHRAGVGLESIDDASSPTIALESVKQTIATIFQKIREMLAALKKRIVESIRKASDAGKTAAFKDKLSKAEAKLKEKYSQFKPFEQKFSENNLFAAIGENVTMDAAVKAILNVADIYEKLGNELRSGCPQWMSDVEAWAKDGQRKVKNEESFVSWANDAIAFGYRKSQVMNKEGDPKMFGQESGRERVAGEKILVSQEMLGGYYFVTTQRPLKPATSTLEAKDNIGVIAHNHLISLTDFGYDKVTPTVHVKRVEELEAFRKAVEKLCDVRETFNGIITELTKRYEPDRPEAKNIDALFRQLHDSNAIGHGSAMQKAYELIADPSIYYLDHMAKALSYINYLCGNLTGYSMHWVSKATGEQVGTD